MVNLFPPTLHDLMRCHGATRGERTGEKARRLGEGPAGAIAKRGLPRRLDAHPPKNPLTIIPELPPIVSPSRDLSAAHTATERPPRMSPWAGMRRRGESSEACQRSRLVATSGPASLSRRFSRGMRWDPGASAVLLSLARSPLPPASPSGTAREQHTRPLEEGVHPGARDGPGARCICGHAPCSGLASQAFYACTPRPLSSSFADRLLFPCCRQPARPPLPLFSAPSLSPRFHQHGQGEARSPPGSVGPPRSAVLSLCPRSLVGQPPDHRCPLLSPSALPLAVARCPVASVMQVAREPPAARSLRSPSPPSRPTTRSSSLRSRSSTSPRSTASRRSTCSSRTATSSTSRPPRVHTRSSRRRPRPHRARLSCLLPCPLYPAPSTSPLFPAAPAAVSAQLDARGPLWSTRAGPGRWSSAPTLRAPCRLKTRQAIAKEGRGGCPPRARELSPAMCTRTPGHRCYRLPPLLHHAISSWTKEPRY